MVPRPAPDLERRRHGILEAARAVAEAEGWAAVTVRRLAERLSVSQPVLYSAFDSRQEIIDAVALAGFDEMAAALETARGEAEACMRTYVDFAAAHPRVYEAMFGLPTSLSFAADDTPPPLRRAFAALQLAFPDDDGTLAEVAWSTLHGLTTLNAAGRLRPDRVDARLELARRALAAHRP
jgi:AcrR family transcriptional regulator